MSFTAESEKYLKDVIEIGNIVTSTYDNNAAVGRYQGNGRFGCVYSKLGLHAHPFEQSSYDAYGKTQYMHIKHWGRFAFYSENMKADTSADYLIPLLKTYWDEVSFDVSNYSQIQSFYDGTVTTGFNYNGENEISLMSWFDATNRNLSAIRLEVKNSAPSITIAPVTEFIPYIHGFKDNAYQNFTTIKEGDQWRIEITCLTTTPKVTSNIYIYSNAEIKVCPEGLKILLVKGINDIYISYDEPVNINEAAASLSNTKEYWHGIWKNSGWLNLPDVDSQKMWVRSMAYILSTFNDDGMGFAPTNGFTGNPFPFNFVQDMFYVHPVLLATGNTHIAKTWIEQFRNIIDDMKAYAKRLWGNVEGIYPPWELPCGSIEGYHLPSIPIIFCYQPQNSAYLSRMAHETGIMVNDPVWIQTNVVPLIREIALFYKSFCEKGEDGHWHLFLTPSIGQDEAGGRDQKDYLCNLYGAKYSFQRAIEYGLDTEGSYRTILNEGLAFPGLLSDKEFFYTTPNSGTSDFGKQKHPVQLNGLAYLPVESSPINAERKAYELRYDITSRAKEPYFYGWTLGEFLLASSHMQDVDGWQKDWTNVSISDIADMNSVQLYETSSATQQSFYITTHGLFAQSLYNNIISDYWGKLVIAPCNVYSRTVHFGNFYSILGVKVSGEVTGRTATVTLEAWKDCKLDVHGIHVNLKKGDTKELKLQSI